MFHTTLNFVTTHKAVPCAIFYKNADFYHGDISLSPNPQSRRPPTVGCPRLHNQQSTYLSAVTSMRDFKTRRPDVTAASSVTYHIAALSHI